MEYYFIINHIVNFILGMALVLWGLKLFKIWITVFGVLWGIVFGLILGLYFAGIRSDVLGLYILLGAVLFGIFAWKFHKLMVYILTGICGALILVIVGYAVNFLPGILALLGFVVGIFLAVKFYEKILIVLFSFIGANSIFYAIYSLSGASIFFNPLKYFSYNGDKYLTSYLSDLSREYLEGIVIYLIIVISLVLFAYNYQTITNNLNRVADELKQQYKRFIRITQLYASIGVADIILSAIFIINYSEFIGYGYGDFFPFSGTALLLVSAGTWHICAYLNFILYKYYMNLSNKKDSYRKIYMKLLYIYGIILILNPLTLIVIYNINWLLMVKVVYPLFFSYHGASFTPNLSVFQINNLFLAGSIWIPIVKFAWCFCLFPLVIYKAFKWNELSPADK